MKIRIKLYAMLAEYLPAGAEKNEADLEVADGATVQRVILDLGLPDKHCHLVLVNGAFVPPEERARKELEEDDQLAIWPPVAGG